MAQPVHGDGLSGNDAFTKAQGQLGANPGTRRGCASARAPTSATASPPARSPSVLDELAGEEAEVEVQGSRCRSTSRPGVFEFVLAGDTRLRRPAAPRPGRRGRRRRGGPVQRRRGGGDLRRVSATRRPRRTGGRRWRRQRLGQPPDRGAGRAGWRPASSATRLCVQRRPLALRVLRHGPGASSGNYKDGAVTKVRAVDQIAPGSRPATRRWRQDGVPRVPVRGLRGALRQRAGPGGRRGPVGHPPGVSDRAPAARGPTYGRDRHPAVPRRRARGRHRRRRRCGSVSSSA